MDDHRAAASRQTLANRSTDSVPATRDERHPAAEPVSHGSHREWGASVERFPEGRSSSAPALRAQAMNARSSWAGRLVWRGAGVFEIQVVLRENNEDGRFLIGWVWLDLL